MKNILVFITKDKKTLSLYTLALFSVVLTGAFIRSKFSAHPRELIFDNVSQYYVDFDASMRTSSYEKVMKNLWGPQVSQVFRFLYEKNNFLHVIPAKITKIPKVIHQIWLGSPFPEKYKAFAQSWKENHPDWEYRLWTDKDVPGFKLENKALYDAATNYGEKSDILRYEILYRHGGLYVDTDFECLKRFDILNHCYDFYIGIQPLDTELLQLGIGLIGSIPNHPIIRKAMDRLKETINTPQIIAKTGPIFFTRVFCESILAMPGINIAMPSSYFYPCGYNQDLKKSNLWQKPESFAVHHWEGSWLKEEAFEKR